jgi:hypothetical protein
MEELAQPLTLRHNPVKSSKVIEVTRSAVDAYLQQFTSPEDLQLAAKDLARVAIKNVADVQPEKRDPFFTAVLSRLSLKELVRK